MPKIELNHICKVYDQAKAVDDFNLVIDDKEFIIFVGPSGCGKSTTLRMIAGLEEISSGELLIDGQKMNHVPASDRNIAMVFQNYALYPHMSVAKNIGYSLRVHGATKDEIKQKVDEVAKMLRLEPYLERKPGQLSGGQKQRVAIGRAMVRHPKIFLMDEPLSNLDAKLRGDMRLEIARLYQKLDATFIYVTHDQTEAMTLGTRIVVMKDGVIQQIDSPKNLFEHPANIFVATFIGSPAMNLFEGTIKEDHPGLVLSTDYHQQFIHSKKFVQAKEKLLNSELVVGIRANDMTISPTPSDTSIQGSVLVYEMLGEEAVIHVRLENPKKDITVKTSSKHLYHVGEQVFLEFMEQGLHFFDRQTEASLL